MTITKPIRRIQRVERITLEKLKAAYTPEIGEAYVRRNAEAFYDMYFNEKNKSGIVDILIEHSCERRDSFSLGNWMRDFCIYKDARYCEALNRDFVKFLQERGLL